MADIQKIPPVWAGPPYMPDVTAAQVGPQVFSAPSAEDAPPALPTISMPRAIPSVFTAPPLMEKVSGPVDQLEAPIEDASARLKKLQMPYDYADHSKLRNFGHIAAGVGNVLGDIVAPSTMALIPKTQLNNQMQEESLGQRLQSLTSAQSEDQQRNAAAAKDEAQTEGLPQQQADASAQSAATTREANARAVALQNPKPTNEFELWHAQNPQGTVQDFEAIQKQPLSADDAKARNAVWDTIAPQYHLPTGQFKAGMSAADAGALAAAMNQVVGRNQGGTKINIQQQTADQAGSRTRDADTEKEFMAAQKDLGSQFSTANTQSETLDQAVQELNSGAVGQAVGTIKTLVGLAGGKGTGVRITQAELNALANARGLGGDFEGYFNKLSGEGSLSSQQKTDMTTLLGDVASTIRGKMGLQDQYLDKLSAAKSPAEIREVQSEYRKALLNGGKGGTAAGGPKAGDVEGGYRFKGGDPHVQSNWEQVKK